MKKTLTVLTLILSIVTYAQNGATTVVILHLNDIHAKIERFPELKYKVDSIKKVHEDVFLFSAGDLFSGNPFVDRHSKKGWPLVDLMNDVGFDITAIGNHEFDYGQEILNTRIQEARFPFISANINSESAVLNQPKAYHIFKTKSGLELAVISAIQLGKNGIPASHPDNLKKIKFYEPVESVKKYKSELKQTDAQIALTHLGYEKDLELAKENQWLELVIGGHSHTTLKTGTQVDKVLVTQAGSNVRYLGFTKMVFLGEKVKSIQTELLSLKKQNEDSLLREKVKEYTANEEFHKEIAFLPFSINNKEELGELMAQAYQERLNVDIAFQNLGGVRIRNLKEGSLKLVDLMKLDPFNNEMLTFKMYPREILEFLNYAYKVSKKEDILISGIEASYKLNKQGELVDIELKDMNGKVLIVNGMYTVAINSYMAEAFEFSAKDKSEYTGKYSNDILIEFFKSKFPLSKINK